MKKLHIKTIITICAFLILPAALFAQKEDKAAQWTVIESPKKEFSFAVPADFLVDNEEKKNYRVISFQDEVTMRIEIDASGNGKDRVRQARRFPVNSAAKTSQFTLGDFIGNVYEYQRDKGFYTSISAASSKAFYRISLSAKDSQSPLLEKFLYSIKLDERPLYKREGQVQSANEMRIAIDTLATSPIILDALKKEDAARTIVKYDLDGKKISDNTNEEKYSQNTDEKKYSRPFITLRQPRASYGAGGTTGTVNLKVLFRADGTIGEITALSRPDNMLMRNATDAARKIKFLPAEVDGKPVDVIRTVEYNFNVY